MQADQRFLTPVEQEAARAWEEFFAHPGWNLFLQRFEPLADGIITMYRNAATEGALGYVRGRDDALQAVVNLEHIIEAEYAQLSQARSEPADADD